MKWDYRAYAQDDKEHDSLVDDMPVEIHLTFYNDDGTARRYFKNSTVNGDSMKELKQCLEKMTEALNKPVLSRLNFPQEYKP